MRKILLLCLLICILFISCEIFGEDGILGGLVDDTPTSSIMTVTFNETTNETQSSVYQVDFNKDDLTISTGNYVLNMKHMKGNKECDYGWTFQSNDVKLNNITENSCAVDITQLKGLGTYSITAISEVSEELNKTLIINATSALAEIAIDYEIQSKYKKSGLEYTDEMLSGTITRFTKEVTFASGAVYDFYVRDASENNLPIENITVNNTTEYVATREIYDNTCQVVCKQYDDKSSQLTVRVGTSAIYLTVKIKLKDITNSVLHELDITENVEGVLSFVKNTAEDPDKAYTYQIKTTAVLEGRKLNFSLDYENWNRENEEIYAGNPKGKYDFSKRDINGNQCATWRSNSMGYKTFETTELFKIEFDGVTGSFSIIPENDTIYTHSVSGEEKNLHCYLYVKYEEDPNTIYRYRWRIMVGGKLENLQLALLDAESGNESIPEEDIAVKEGDTTGWIFRAKYIPQTTDNNKTLWYISDSKKAYTWENGGVSFVAPAPISAEDTRSKVLNMMQYIESDTPFYSAYVNKYFICSELGRGFECYKYFYEECENGHSDLWTTYNSLGKDLVVVALNLETKMYCSIAIKDLGDKQIIVKGIQNDNTPLNVFGKATGYLSKSEIQEYPKTMVVGYETHRTFYMDVNEIFKLRVISSFKMEQLEAYGNSDARDIFPNISADLDYDGLGGTLKFETYYHMVEGTSAAIPKEQCITGLDKWADILLKVDNKYQARLRIVVYDAENTELTEITEGSGYSNEQVLQALDESGVTYKKFKEMIDTLGKEEALKAIGLYPGADEIKTFLVDNGIYDVTAIQLKEKLDENAITFEDFKTMCSLQGVRNVLLSLGLGADYEDAVSFLETNGITDCSAEELLTTLYSKNITLNNFKENVKNNGWRSALISLKLLKGYTEAEELIARRSIEMISPEELLGALERTGVSLEDFDSNCESWGVATALAWVGLVSGEEEYKVQLILNANNLNDEPLKVINCYRAKNWTFGNFEYYCNNYENNFVFGTTNLRKLQNKHGKALGVLYYIGARQ